MPNENKPIQQRTVLKGKSTPLLNAFDFKEECTIEDSAVVGQDEVQRYLAVGFHNHCQIPKDILRSSGPFVAK